MFEDQTLASLRSLRTVRALRPLRAVSRLEGMKVKQMAWVCWVGTPLTNYSTFLPGCRERAVFRHTRNRQRAPGISPVLVDIQYSGGTAFRWKILQVPGLGRRTCSGRHRTKQDGMLGTPWQIPMGKFKCEL